MKSKGYTYVKELEVFKKNHLLDTDLKNIKVIVERLMNDLSTVLKSNPNIESLIHSLLLQKIQRRGEIYVLVYNDITISFEHLDTESILDAVVVEVERELTKDDVEHEDVDTKTTQPEINEYFVYLVRSLNNQKEADAELSSNIIKNLEQRGFKFTNQDNKIEEVIEILADRYEVDAEEIDYKVGNTKSTVKALKVRNYETQEERGNEILTSEMISELNLKVVEILKSQESKSLSYFKLSEYLLHNIKYVGEEHLSLILQEGFKQKLYTTYQDSQGNYILTLNNNEQDKVHKNGKDKEKSPLILDESLRVDNHDLDDNTIIDEIIYHIYTSNHIMSYQEIEDIIKINYPFINSKQFEEIVRKAVKDNNICYQQDSRGTFYLYLNDNQKKYASTLQEPIHPPSPLPPIEPSPFSPNPLINDGEEYEDNYNYEEERERKGIGIPTIIAGGVTLGIIGVIAWDFQEEIVNYIQDFFNSESQNVSNVEVESPIPTATASIDIHTVIRGDNLWNIAHSYLGGSATNAQILELTNNLAQINNISNPDLIHPGDQIRVPQELLEQIRNH
ncbi:MAG: LysM peptidoglycan-binding domain-containing protein [Nanoarchaeota archaeon]|nr:LysM peptidoglycan-binding domain-containing protein [Nanoarchaeota archaeon]